MSARYPVPLPLRARAGLPGLWNTPLYTQGPSGDASITLDAVTTSATGKVAIAGAASPTLAAVTLSAAGTVAIAGAASPTLGNVTLSAAGALALKGAADLTLGDVTLAAAGVLSAPGTGTADITLADVTVGAAATLALAGSASITLSGVTTSATGALSLSGSASLTLDAVTLSAAGQASGPVSGEAAITLGDVTVQAEGGTKRGGRRKRVRDGLGEARLMSTKGQASITLDAVSVIATGEIVVPQAPEVVLPPIAASVSVMLDDISCKARGEGAAMVDGLKRSTVPNGLLLKRLANIEQMLAHMKATQ